MAAPCARASGAITSRSGSDRVTPIPRSSVRREIAWKVQLRCPLAFSIGVSLKFKQVAFDDSMDDTAQSVPGIMGSLENVFHLFPIRETDRRSSGVGGKLADEVSSDGSLLVI